MAALKGYLGTVYGAKQWALQFADTDQLVTVPDPSGGELDLGAAQDFSIEMWAAVSDTGDGDLISKNGNELGWKLAVSDNFLLFVQDDTNSDIRLQGAIAVNTDKWAHLVAVRQAGGDCKLYVNGEADETVADGSASLLNASDVLIGNSANTNVRRIGLVRCYTSMLSDAQISDLYKGNFVSDCFADLACEYYMEEGDDFTRLHDSSKRENHATLANATWVNTTYDTETTEAVTLASSTTGSTAYQNVGWDNLTVTVGGVSKYHDKHFNLTPKGTINFLTAQASDVANVTYRHWPMTVELAGFFNWSMTIQADDADITDFRTTGWRRKTTILKGWNGTAERHWAGALAENWTGREVIMRFYMDENTPSYLTGWGNCTGYATGANVEAVVDQTLNFQGTYKPGTETT